MKISMYQASVPRLTNSLRNLDHILEKAQAHVDKRHLDDAVFVNFRLYPDMLSLCTQVQIACENAQGAVARLAGIEVPVDDDKERTIGDLKERIAKTIAFIQEITPDQIDGTEDKEIITKRGGQENRYTGIQYLLGHVMPNVYFHITTTYNILRHNGVELAKRDYLGQP